MKSRKEGENTNKEEPRQQDTERQRENPRRDALKVAGAASGLAATGAWVKPVIESVVLPAHGQTTNGDGGPQGFTMRGPTSADPIVQADSDGWEQHIAATMLASAVPAAHALSVSPPELLPLFDEPRFQNCVSIDFPEGGTPFAPITVSVAGAPIYNAYYDGSYQFIEHFQFNGTSGGELEGPDGLDFKVDFGDFRVEGCVTDGDFIGAVGYLIANTSGASSGGSAQTFYSIFSGYGASFEISVGPPCSPGAGNLTTLMNSYGGT